MQATINPTGLGIGTYSGTITVQGTGSIPAQTIPVTLTIASAAVTATPTSLSFTQSVGGSAPASQTIQIGSVPAGTTVGAVATVLNGSGWLTTSVSGSTVTVNANGSQLAAGTYSGVVTVIVPGAQNSPLYVPVTLTIGAAPTLSVSTTTVNMTYQLGSQATLTGLPGANNQHDHQRPSHGDVHSYYGRQFRDALTHERNHSQHAQSLGERSRCSIARCGHL